MEIKVSDYIVEFLIENNVKDIFGYPGGMVTHFIDSLEKYKKEINNHLCYHEQAAAFAACGNSQITNNIGCAYATSGPGATNLITGIGQAYFDSIPVLFITGQVNTYESKGDLTIRQRGFQETDIVSMVKSITKYTVKIDEPENIKYELEKALYISKHDRPGPVLLDIPMDVFRSMINPNKLKEYKIANIEKKNYDKEIEILISNLSLSERPVIVAGSGINIANERKTFRELVDKMKIPVVSSMISVDLLPKSNKYNYGFIGAYGHRYANFTIMNSDLIILMGSRLDCRQTGPDLKLFAPNAKIIRLDVDKNELSYNIKDNIINIECNLNIFLKELNKKYKNNKNYNKWLEICEKYYKNLAEIDKNSPNDFVKKISDLIDEKCIITTDVGQNQVWVSQSFANKSEQRILFSGGIGSMGYSLPSAIGAYYGSKQKIIAFCGDGGFQMNIQEIQFLIREKIPIKIILLNNKSLGMIRHFQEMYFDCVFTQTVDKMGYSTPDFCSIANAYGIESISINKISELNNISKLLCNSKPVLININLKNTTYVYPKLAMGKPIDDQDPLIDRKLYEKLKSL